MATPLQTRQAWEEALKKILVEPIQRARLAQSMTPEVFTQGPAPTVDLQQPDPYAFVRKRKRAGRSSTVLTGDLVPMDIGKRTLLG